ncbi:MAG: iron-containing alcohol dehydrogenase [Chloroflexi bacterium]|nr:iron-containing alcohol dehydrogenase [Chloroflexota bacterium]
MIFSDDASADLAREAGALPPGRALVVTDDGLMRAGLVAPLMEALRGAGRVSDAFSAIPSNPGAEDVRAAMAVARAANPAVVVAVGGGSPIDVAKAVGLLLAHDSDDWESYQWGRSPITNGSRPVIAIPTTAGTGSEVTHVAVIGDHTGFKKGLVHATLFARVAIVDGGLMRGLPPQMTAATGMDAFTHAVEAYLGTERWRRPRRGRVWRWIRPGLGCATRCAGRSRRSTICITDWATHCCSPPCPPSTPRPFRRRAGPRCAKRWACRIRPSRRRWPIGRAPSWPASACRRHCARWGPRLRPLRPWRRKPHAWR